MIAAILLTLYVPTVHVLDLEGGYTKYHLEGAESGVQLEECRLRLDVWREENQDGFAALIEKWAEDGKYAGIRTSCERL